MSVTFVHDFDTEIRAIDDIGPRVDEMTRRVDNRLIEVEAIEVESHSGDTERSKPDTDDWPCTEEEVERTRIVERRVLEDETTKVTMCSRDGVSFGDLAKVVTSVEREIASSFCEKRGSDERTMHSGEERATEDCSDTKEVEWMHEDVVFCLEDEHEVEGAGDTKWHTVGEGTLTDWIDDEDSGSSSNWCREGEDNPWTHRETEGEFPFTAHPCRDTSDEVKDDELIGATVVEPFVVCVRFPDWIEVDTDSVGRRNEGTRDDIVTIEERTCDWLTDTIDVDWRCHDETKDEDSSCKDDEREEEEAEVTNVETVVSGNDGRESGTPDGRGGRDVENLFHSTREIDHVD